MVHTTILSITDLLNLATDTFFKQDAYYNKLHYTSWCFCLEFTQQFFAKFSNAKCHEKLSIVRWLVSWGQTDGRKDITKLIAAFRNFANAPKMASDGAEGSTHEVRSVFWVCDWLEIQCVCVLMRDLIWETREDRNAQMKVQAYVSITVINVSFDKTGNVRITQHSGAFMKPLLRRESIVTQPESASVALGIQHQCACALLSTVVCPALHCFSTLSHKRYDFRQTLLDIKCVFWCHLQLSSDTFLIIRRTERDMIKICGSLHVKCPLFLSDFHETRIFSTVFSKNIQMSSFMKIRPMGPSCSMQSDGQTDMTKLYL